MKVTDKKALNDKSGSPDVPAGAADPAILRLLSDQFKPARNLRLEIKHLWDNYFRLNFWGESETKDKTPSGTIIKESKFVKVTQDEAGNYQAQARE